MTKFTSIALIGALLSRHSCWCRPSRNRTGVVPLPPNRATDRVTDQTFGPKRSNRSRNGAFVTVRSGRALAAPGAF